MLFSFSYSFFSHHVSLICHHLSKWSVYYTLSWTSTILTTIFLNSLCSLKKCSFLCSFFCCSWIYQDSKILPITKIRNDSICQMNYTYTWWCLFHQVVANCLSGLQEIWTLESTTSEEAARERETLHSKPVVYYFLNR